MAEKETFYITKYALTRGILKVKGTFVDGGGTYRDDYARISTPIASRNCFWYPDYYLTLEGAITRAETLKRNKIASLKRQLKKIQNIKFTEEEVKEV